MGRIRKLTAVERTGRDLIEQVADLHRQFAEISFPVPFSERELVERVLFLAGDPTEAQKLEALSTSVLSHGPVADQTTRITKTGEGKELIRQAWNTIAPERAQFRSQIELIYQDRQSARTVLRPAIETALRDIVLIPSLAIDGWSISYNLHYCALNVSASAAFAIVMLLDENRPFGAALRRCKLRLCPNFFVSLSGPKGGKPRWYCSTEHRLIDANADSPNRKRRERARKAK